MPEKIDRLLVYSIVKRFVFSVLVIIFIMSVSLSYFTITNPQEVIDRLEPLVPTVTPDPVRLLGVAVLGDSQSDEYRADDNRGDNYPSATKNWVELLVENRKMNFGPWGSWDEPRRTGYEYNWSRSGATVASLLEAEAHVGIAEEVKAKKVNLVVVFVGAIDFAPYFTPDGYDNIYNGNLSEAVKKRKINRIIADIKTAVYTIKDAGDVRIVLVSIPDWGNHTGIQVGFPYPDQRANVSKMITETNRELVDLSEVEHLGFVDMNSLYQNFPKNDEGKVVVGDVVLQRLLLNNNPRNFYMSDGVHYGTIVNGLLANAILKEMNAQLENPILPLSEEEIIKNAGL